MRVKYEENLPVRVGAESAPALGVAESEAMKRRTRSLNAPSPIQQFGPCGRIIKKVRDAMVIPPFIQLVKWFINEKRMVVFVESA